MQKSYTTASQIPMKLLIVGYTDNEKAQSII